MIVIIDGPRGAGKTTLAEYIRDQATHIGLNAYIAKNARPEDPLEFMLERIREGRGNHILILDRFHWTEWVMSCWHKREAVETLDAWCKTVEVHLTMTPTVGFILQASTAMLAERIAMRNDDRGYEMPLNHAVRIWEAALERSRIMMPLILRSAFDFAWAWDVIRMTYNEYYGLSGRMK